MANPSWTLRCISVPGPDTDLSLFVSFDNARFLFGAGEGTQRAFVQKRLGMRGLQAVFLPCGGSRARGGLPGVLMTAADAGMKKLTVAGPPDLAHYVATLRSSVIREALSVDTNSFPRNSTKTLETVFTSPNITVHAVALRPDSPNQVADAMDIDVVSPVAGPSHSRPRPSQLSRAELDTWTGAIVKDMFRGTDPSPSPSRPPLYPGMYRLAQADDRFPLPLPSDADVATEMVYICRTPDVRGKFDVKRAEELKVPRGAERGKLTRGESIQVADPDVPGGMRLVRPEDCLVGGGPGSVLIIVHCSEHNLDRLLASRAFTEHQRESETVEVPVPVHCVVHRVPRSVWEDPRYQVWVAAFGTTTQHLFADATGDDRIFFNSATWNALQLHLLDSTIFPVPHHAFQARLPSAVSPSNSATLVPNHSITMFPPRPPTVLPNHEKDRMFPIDTTGLDTARSVLQAENPDYADAVEQARAKVASEVNLRKTAGTVPGDDIVVTTLGTGSAIPSKYRNVSSTHLDIPGLGGVLLDAGEGTLGQLRRRYGPLGLRRVYAELKLVFISHMHADHHLGLAAILEDRFKCGITSTLYLVAPHAIALQLQETAAWQAGVPQDNLESVKFINITRLRNGWSKRRSTAEHPVELPSPPPREASLDRAVSPMEDLEEQSRLDLAAGRRKWPPANVFRFQPDTNERAEQTIVALLDDLQLMRVHAPTVEHRGTAYGLVLHHRSGWKVVYSGDTMPCDALVEAGRGATILIHEATLEDDKPEVAAAKGHSTFSQAIDVGRRMNARYVILNHFSQRYPKLPKLPPPALPATLGVIADSVNDDTGPSSPPLSMSRSHSTTSSSAGPIEPVVAISFDFMSLRVRDAWKMAHYMDAVSVLYAEEDDEGDAESVVEVAKGDGAGDDDSKAEESKAEKSAKAQKANKIAQAVKAAEIKAARKAKWQKKTTTTTTTTTTTDATSEEDSSKGVNVKAAGGTKRPSDASSDERDVKKLCEGGMILSTEGSSR